MIRALEFGLLLVLVQTCLGPIGFAQMGSAQTLPNQDSRNGAVPPCAIVSGERILGRDLAMAVPELVSLPPDLALGYAPMPGIRRVFLVGELRRLASRYGVDARASAKIAKSVCFAWPVHPLAPQAVMEALRKSLAGREAELELTDQCRLPVPEGDLVFPLQGLTAESSRPTLWNGYVLYAGNRRFNTWVTVRVILHEKQLVAARDIREGEFISPHDFDTVDYSGPLHQTTVLRDEKEAAGKCARRFIAAGTVLSEPMLALPQDVEKQQIVTVHTRCGAAHIETQGIAVEAGYRGDVIKVKNPKTGRIFSAQISDHGVVTVVPGGEVGLVVNDKKS